jgi:hypothetical protein
VRLQANVGRNSTLFISVLSVTSCSRIRGMCRQVSCSGECALCVWHSRSRGPITSKSSPRALASDPGNWGGPRFGTVRPQGKLLPRKYFRKRRPAAAARAGPILVCECIELRRFRACCGATRKGLMKEAGTGVDMMNGESALCSYDQ